MMKRWLVWLAAILMILCGCNAPQAETTAPTVSTTQQEETMPSLPLMHAQESSFEAQAGEELRVFVPEGNVTGMIPMGEDLALFQMADNDEQTAVLRITADGYIKASGILNGWISSGVGNVAAQSEQFVYYDREENCCRILDGSFREQDTVALPDGTESVLLDSTLTVAYYTIGGEIRAMDLQTGIARLVCSMNVSSIYLDSLLFDGTVLDCYVNDGEDAGNEVFLSTENGEKLGSTQDLLDIFTWEDRYFLRRMDGAVVEFLLSSRDGELQTFRAEDNSWDIRPLSTLGNLSCILGTDDGVRLDLYETELGSRLAMLELTGATNLCDTIGSTSGEYVFFLAGDPELGRNVLCRWAYGSATGADTVARITQRHTSNNPDKAALERCRQQAQTLGETYGVDILLYRDVVEPDDYTFEPEHQPEALEQALADLKSVLSRFPEDFFRTVSQVCDDGTVHICLVRSMTATTDNAPATTDALQYWINGTAWIALTTGHTVEQDFCHEMSHVLDTFVFSNSIHYDFWEDWNPKGFAYDENYTDYGSHEDSPWLEDETRAFIDAYSMTYAKEDRARFFEYAMMDHSAYLFGSETMQYKLRQLCWGIREAFGWENYEGSFPWEQHLTIPLYEE